jgi:phage terminase large subunit-like protein
MKNRTIPRNAAAKAAIEFVETLTLVGDDSGKPVKLMPFQKEILAVLFGAMDKKGKRKIKRCFILMPRKQAKTFLAACIVLYWLLGLGLKGQQCLSIANAKEQAALLFGMAKQIVEADEELQAVTEVIGTIDSDGGSKRITVPSLNSFYAALSSESKTKTGFNPSLVIIDEAQDIADPALIKNVTTGRTARDDYLTIFVGTAGTRKDTPYYAEYEYAKSWIAGTVENENYYAWIYEADPEKDDWTDEKVWKRVMPAYGKFCKPEAVREEFELALKMPHKRADFEQYMLSIWQIFGGVSWIADNDWMANATAPLGDASEYYAGFDKASVLDTTSLVLFGLNSRGLWDVIPFIWVCEAQVEERRTADFDYKVWADKGHLRVTAGSAQDEIKIADDIGEIIKQYNTKMFSIDRAGTSYIATRLQAYGFDPAAKPPTLVGFGQGVVSMTEPIKEISKLVLAHSLCHGGHPVLRWMVNNVKLNKDDKDNYSFSKKHSKEKIDGCTALANAVGVAIPAIAQAAVGMGQSVYEERGLLIL